MQLPKLFHLGPHLKQDILHNKNKNDTSSDNNLYNTLV